VGIAHTSSVYSGGGGHFGSELRVEKTSHVFQTHMCIYHNLIQTCVVLSLMLLCSFCDREREVILGIDRCTIEKETFMYEIVSLSFYLYIFEKQVLANAAAVTSVGSVLGVAVKSGKGHWLSDLCETSMNDDDDDREGKQKEEEEEEDSLMKSTAGTAATVSTIESSSSCAHELKVKRPRKGISAHEFVARGIRTPQEMKLNLNKLDRLGLLRCGREKNVIK
jgi:hypothetical protein